MTEINVVGRGPLNRIENFPETGGPWTDGTIVRYQNPDTGFSCIGIFSAQHNCDDCIFKDHECCPWIVNHGRICSIISGAVFCAIISIEDLI